MDDKPKKTAKRKRKWGTGSVFYQESKDIWVGRYRQQRKSAYGKEIDITVYGKTENEANRKLDEAIRKEKEKPEYDPGPDMLVSDLLLLWLKTRIDLKPKSYDRLEQTVELVIRYIGSKTIQSLTSIDVSTMVAEMKNEGKGYSTVKKARECVSACFEWAMEQEPDPIARYNPAKKVSIGSKDSYTTRKSTSSEDGDDADKDIRFYTSEQAAKIAKAAVSTYKTGTPILFGGPIVIVMLNTGVRVGEMAGLKWSDIDFQKRLLHVKRNVVLIKNREAKDGEPKYHEVVQDSTKTSSGRRVIPLTEEAIKALNTLKERSPDSVFIAVTQKGVRKSLRNIDRLCRSAEKMAGVPVYGCHALRHTFATLLLRSGNVDISTISKLLGHADVSTTYNIYIHVIEQAKIEAMGELPSFLPTEEDIANASSENDE